MSHEHDMPKTVSTVIDGRSVEVQRDRWCLEVCRELGIEIPTLCYHPALAPYGACRLCVVEVTKGKWTWLTTSCDLPIREGLEIRTDTPAVRAARKMALELLWAQAPDAEPIRQLAEQMGIEKPRFAARKETGKCILCGLCVRVCESILGQSAIGFDHRGPKRNVGSPFGAPAEMCIGCGACVDICPTGHVECLDADGRLRLPTWNTELDLVPCEQCGRPYLPKKELEFLQSKMPEGLDHQAICPACRRSGSATTLARGLAATPTKP